MSSVSLTSQIKSAARDIGFDLVGIAPAVTPTGISQLHDWMQSGFSGEMSYIPRRKTAYEHPRSVLESVRSLIVVAVNYRSTDPQPAAANQGRIARYAWGNADYHDVLRDQLRQLADQLHAWSPGCRTRVVVDTAPLLERDFARLAGLGWFGKNTLLIHKQLGSMFFLGALLTDLELEFDEPHATSHCGTCTRCLDVCPTDAFSEPYVLDARKCISYLTIELKTSMPHELRPGVGEWLFGCDLCQDVCPWNRKAPHTAQTEFAPQSDLNPARALDLLNMTEDEFQRRFAHTPLSRPGWVGLRRNALIVLGNRGDTEALPALVAALNDPVPLLRGTAAWALGQHKDKSAAAALQSRLDVEDNEEVRRELISALAAGSNRRNT